MSADVLVQLGTKGADAVCGLTRTALAEAIKKNGKTAAVAFPETNLLFFRMNKANGNFIQRIMTNTKWKD